MPKYIVWVREVWVQPFEVLAADQADAVKRVHDGEGVLVENALEYSETLEPTTWTVQKS